MNIQKAIYKSLGGTLQKQRKQYPSKSRTPRSPEPINKSWEEIVAELKQEDGKYIRFLNKESNKNLYGNIKAALNIESGTPLDQFVSAMCFRAQAVNEGFLTLTHYGNFLTACSMIRMQLDSALICLAGLKCKNQHDFFLAFNSGTPINKLKDEEGNLLTQNFLVKSFEDSEIKEIFDNGNRYVHPSRLFQDEAIDLTDGLKLLSYQEYQTPERIRKEAYRQMLLANNVLADMLVKWVLIKNNNGNN